MSIKTFFSEYSLYQKFKTDLTEKSSIDTPALNLYCPKCKSIQTFSIHKCKNPLIGIDRPVSKALSDGGSRSSPSIQGTIFDIIYKCAACNYYQYYLIKVSDDSSYLMKVGEHPSLNIEIDKPLKSFLGKNFNDYKKGILCEKHGFGIGAFSYYRRIVENTIDDMLNLIKENIDPNEQNVFQAKLNKIQDKHNNSDKIKVINEYLPNDLKVEGNNPLKSLYGSLSEGIHNLSDEECLIEAKKIKSILNFVFMSLNSRKEYRKNYVESIKNLKY